MSRSVSVVHTLVIQTDNSLPSSVHVSLSLSLSRARSFHAHVIHGKASFLGWSVTQPSFLATHSSVSMHPKPVCTHFVPCHCSSSWAGLKFHCLTFATWLLLSSNPNICISSRIYSPGSTSKAVLRYTIIKHSRHGNRQQSFSVTTHIWNSC